MSLTGLFPREMLRSWHLRQAPTSIPWPAIDDEEVWPADMPLELRAEPQRWCIEYWWYVYESPRVVDARIGVYGMLIAALCGVGAWRLWSNQMLATTLLVIGGLTAAFAIQGLIRWRRWDARDWSHLVQMWPHKRVRDWRDREPQERPWWWPHLLWVSMNRGTYRAVRTILLFPVVAPIAVSLVALAFGAIGVFVVGLITVISWMS